MKTRCMLKGSRETVRRPLRPRAVRETVPRPSGSQGTVCSSWLPQPPSGYSAGVDARTAEA
jgi:hypothetical protein